MTCHTPAAGHALSFNTRQLNLPGALAGHDGNFIDQLGLHDYLAGDPPAADTLPRHLRPGETSYSLEARVRSYLDVNCAYCHQSGGTGGGNWDGRHHLTLGQTGLINQASVDSPIHPGDLLVIPGDVSASILHSRTAATNGYTRMPPLGSNLTDPEGVQLISDWILQEAGPLNTYDQWRTAKFGNNQSLTGARHEDPDGDSLTNLQEYLLLTDPHQSSTFPTPAPRPSNGQLAIPLPALPGRQVAIERSTDLIHWQLWNAPGNDLIPRNPASSETLQAPASGPGEFFRYRIGEN
jgi:hypothetical protein